MTAVDMPRASDMALLSISESVLREHGFFVEVLSGDVNLVLAENPYFVLAIGAFHTTADLIVGESLVEAALLARLDRDEIGPKKWDVYLVLLTQERSPEDDATTRDLYAINYDTAQLRRIVQTELSATPAAVTHALASFLAPIAPETEETLENPLDALAAALHVRGVDRELADRAIAAFEQGAALDDVL